MLDELRIDEQAVAEKVAAFIRATVHQAGLDGAVIALSGGIDSAVTAYVTVEALGPDAVRLYNMPYETSNPESEAHARLVADDLGAPFEVISVTPQIDAYFDRFPEADRLRRANKMARERMSVIYDMGKLHHAMVVGTGNKTETLLGYTTIWGDMACGIAPIGDLYKAQVRQLAQFLGVHEPIIQKPPSADLWAGQTDEDELGLTYNEADAILYRLIECDKTPDEIVEDGASPETVRKVLQRVEHNEFKRRMPPVCDLSQFIRG
ncbi:MAG: NAD+ synthase [Armatimonadota bacterium]